MEYLEYLPKVIIKTLKDNSATLTTEEKAALHNLHASAKKDLELCLKLKTVLEKNRKNKLGKDALDAFFKITPMILELAKESGLEGVLTYTCVDENGNLHNKTVHSDVVQSTLVSLYTLLSSKQDRDLYGEAVRELLPLRDFRDKLLRESERLGLREKYITIDNILSDLEKK